MTVAVELAVAAALGIRARWQLMTIVAVNLLTNPALIVILAVVAVSAARAYWPVLAVLETAIVVIEWLLLRRLLGFRPPRLARLAATMNAASLLTGALLFWL